MGREECMTRVSRPDRKSVRGVIGKLSVGGRRVMLEAGL